jgi:hypothetical protein
VSESVGGMARFANILDCHAAAAAAFLPVALRVEGHLATAQVGE